MRKFVIIVAATGLALTASACNTVKGLGQDVESVGEAGEEVID
ncbi:entericidin A/B family lipoprotein [Alteriqipengyuania sp. WL0013]|nr:MULTISPECIES: entericidin A/B family lipoprotein [Alteriqipengyuania]MEB3415426.1 entericidin A/B family lipoprotein [Alteriqipengyuania sp. WL0013]WJY18752.1 entericidin A/B family lipoprotein [Alteriqipengyuania flavescens]WJY24692.1 entericidin A/B family lipoprotein [Alteriqipengyuania flavescens]